MTLSGAEGMEKASAESAQERPGLSLAESALERSPAPRKSVKERLGLKPVSLLPETTPAKEEEESSIPEKEEDEDKTSMCVCLFILFTSIVKVQSSKVGLTTSPCLID